MKHKHIFAAALVAAAILLTGCGSGSSTDDIAGEDLNIMNSKEIALDGTAWYTKSDKEPSALLFSGSDMLQITEQETTSYYFQGKDVVLAFNADGVVTEQFAFKLTGDDGLQVQIDKLNAKSTSDTYKKIPDANAKDEQSVRDYLKNLEK